MELIIEAGSMGALGSRSGQAGPAVVNGAIETSSEFWEGERG